MTALDTRFQTLCDLTMTEAATAVARGDVSVTELTEASFAAFDAREPKINSVIWREREASLEAAAGLDAHRKAGGAMGPLFGVPLAHKDMYYQKGRLATCGSKIRADFRPDYTATVIERLESAGSVTIAGLNMAEFAQNATGHNAHYGDCHNPWGYDYCTGGSSSGSGAAVGARCVTAALGSDTGGSIRLPAAMCGVTGIKATQTRVSRYGVMGLSFSNDNVGPLTRDVRDAARFLSVIAGHDPKDPTSSTEPVPDYESFLTGDIRGLRIGIPKNYFLDNAGEDVRASYDASIEVLKSLGAIPVEVSLPAMEAVATYVSMVSRCEGSALHATWMRERAQDYAIHLSARMYAGFAIPAVQYIEALSRRGAIVSQFISEVFGACDVLATPTLRWSTPTLAEANIDGGSEEAVELFGNVSINTRPINYLGLPGLTVPNGFDANGIPTGLQLVGRPFAEGTLFRAGDAFQRVSDWHLKKSPAALLS